MHIENHCTQVLAGFCIGTCEFVEQGNASGEFFSRFVVFGNVVEHGPRHQKNREDFARVCFGLCSEDKPKNARFGLMCDGADLFFGNRKSVEKFQGLDHFAGFSLLDYAERNDVSCRIQKIPRFDQMIPSHEELRTQRGAADYLTRVYNECSSAEFAVALGAVCKARQCLSEIARKAGMPRPSLYRTLMEGGNTKLTTLQVILKELDLEVCIKPTSHKELKMNAVEIEAGVS